MYIIEPYKYLKRCVKSKLRVFEHEPSVSLLGLVINLPLLKKKKSIKSSFITFSVVKEAVSNIYPPKKIFLGKYQGSQVPDQSTSFSTRI